MHKNVKSIYLFVFTLCGQNNTWWSVLSIPPGGAVSVLSTPKGGADKAYFKSNQINLSPLFIRWETSFKAASSAFPDEWTI